MSGAIVKAQGFKKLNSVLKKYSDFDVTGVLKSIGQMIVTQTSERFEQEVGPNKKQWKKSKRATEGGKTLRDSSNLLSSIKPKPPTGNSIVVGTNKVYAAIHQFGGEIKPKNANALYFFVPGVGMVKAKKVTMPARPYLGINNDDKEEIRDFVLTKLKRLGVN